MQIKQFNSEIEAGAASIQDGIKDQIHKFRYKSFYEKHHKAASMVAGAGAVGLGVLSIACAWFYASKAAGAVIVWPLVAGLVAALVLVAIEALKNYLLNEIWEGFYTARLNRKDGGVAVGAVVMLAGILGVSVWLSVAGAGDAALHFAGKKTEIQGAGTAQADSIRAAYGAKVAALEAEIASISAHKAKRWAGLLTPSENAQILNLQSRIAEIEDARDIELGKAAIHTMEAVAENMGTALEASYVMAAVAGANELLIILAVWFGWYFSFRTTKEAMLAAGQDQTANVGGGTSALSAAQDNTALNAGKVGFGFRFGGEKSPGAPPANNTALSAEKEDTALSAEDTPPACPAQSAPGNDSALSAVNVQDVPPGWRLVRCAHCGAQFAAKHWAAKYCPERPGVPACRTLAWEKKAGATFVPGKKR